MQITVPVGALRKQRVTVEFGQKDADGNAIVNYWTICGPFEEKNAAALLQYNTSTIHGAFAVKTIADKQMVVLQTNQWPKPSTRLKSAKCWPPLPGRPIRWSKNWSARTKTKDEG